MLSPIETKLAPSKSSEFGRYSLILICLVLVGLGILELSVRLSLAKVSNIEGRTESEFRAAEAVRRHPGAPRSILVLGNSLLLYALDFPQFQKLLEPEYTAARCVVEQTSYLDWYYGMRYLFERGSRPDVVVLMLSAIYLASSDFRGDYTAYRMLLPGDVFGYSREAGLSPTQTFSLYLSNFSAYYGTRSETRKVILFRTIPTVKYLRDSLLPLSVARFDPKRATPVATQRLSRLDNLARSYGCQFVYAEAPALVPAYGPVIREAASRDGIRALVPISFSSLSTGDFRDGHHLSDAGAHRYTILLAQALRDALK